MNSPQTLMLSGIGDPEELKAHGIDAKVALRGVGKNLQDHPAALITYARNGAGPLRENMRLDRIAFEVGRGLAFGKGFATSMPGGITAFLKSDASEALPDVQLLFIAGPLFDAKPYLAVREAVQRRLRLPHRGAAVGLARHDLAQIREPEDAPRISQNLLATDHDKRKIRAAVKLFREIGAQKAMQSFIKAEVLPGAAKQAMPNSTRDPPDRRHGASPGLLVPDGHGRNVCGRWRAARARHRGLAAGRCLGDAGPRRRQHQCGGDHDRREGRADSDDPGQVALRAVCFVNPGGGKEGGAEGGMGRGDPGEAIGRSLTRPAVPSSSRYLAAILS